MPSQIRASQDRRNPERFNGNAVKRRPRVDILHSDIQGAESEVFHHAISLLNERVRRVVVGTHTRKIEGELMDLFSANGHGI